MFTSIAILAQAAALATAAPVDTASAIATLEGDWEGQLEYRDYQSDQLQAIPMVVEFESVPDGITFIQRAAFSDPGFQVYITSLLSVGEDRVTQANSRAGREPESYELGARISEAVAMDDWSLTFTRIGLDDNRPASIRETMQRDGTQLTITKEVDFLDDDGAEWEFRNRVNLTQS